MKLKSKLREMFSNELLDLIASICDTRRVASLPQKMKILRDLLYTNGIKFEVLGGATNRIAMFIDGYAVKFAMDSQGYRDNLIEYSICNELQPYVTKTYETNGYIVIAECVRLMTESEFIARKQDILNILMALSEDYLLGDVGFLQKNRTNWGIRDNGELVILDYAYCHRATENLFTCPVCGEGVLTYTSDFDKLICTNRSVCHAVFTYNQRKQEQGDQVDFDMIEERKSDSIVLKENEDSIEVEDQKKGKFMFKNGKRVIVVDNDSSYNKMMEANKMISTQFDRSEALEALVKLSMTKDTDSVARETIIQNLDNIKVSDDEEYVISEEYQSKIAIYDNDDFHQNDETDDDDEVYGLDYLIKLASSTNEQHVRSGDNAQQEQTHDGYQPETYDEDEDDDSYGLSYLVSLSMKNNGGDSGALLDAEPELEPTTDNDDDQTGGDGAHEPESEEKLNMTNETNVTVNGDFTNDTVEATSQEGKLELSSMYGEMGNPPKSESSEVKIGVTLDGESL